MTTFSKSLMPIAKNRLKTDTRVCVCIRVSHRNKCGYIMTGVDVGCSIQKGKISPNWLGEMITSNEPEWLHKNSEVEKVYQTIRKRYSQCINPGALDCSGLIQVLKNDSLDTPNMGATLNYALDGFCRAKADTVSSSYLEMVKSAVQRLNNWVSGELLLKDITVSLMFEYDKFLHSVNKHIQGNGVINSKVKLSDAQIGKEKAQIKALLNWAVDNGLVEYSRSPFAKITIPRSEGRDCALTSEQIRKIRDCELEGTQAMARDVFMLSFYMGGMNWSDIIEVDWNTDVISFVRNKTKGRTQQKMTTKLPVCENARAILKKYVDKKGHFQSGFHYTNRRDEIGYIGKQLRKLKDTLNLPNNFCFYSARHTFSQLALECGISDTVADYIMSHSNGRRGVICFYSAVTPKMAGLALARVRDYVEHPEKYENEIVAGLLR